jgi:hypothetical protein
MLCKASAGGDGILAANGAESESAKAAVANIATTVFLVNEVIDVFSFYERVVDQKVNRKLVVRMFAR